MSVCKPLRNFCLQKEWAANGFVFLGVLQFWMTIWLSIEHQQTILTWLFSNILVHGAIFSVICAVNVTMMAGFLCLGFSDCAKESNDCAHAIRGRGTGSKVFPNAMDWMEHLGGKKRT